MKVLDLHCSQAHVFEGWFASEDDFQGQLARGLLECPLCGDKTITRRPSAPRLNLGAASPAEPPAGESGKPAAAPAAARPPAELQAAWMHMARRVIAATEDVGERFAEEARRIHYGEAAPRPIRGQATREQTQALLEEGIPVAPLPIPAGLKEPLQ